MADVVKSLISEALHNEKGLLIGKLGTVECNILYSLSFHKSLEIPEEERGVLERNAGVFPCDIDTIMKWGKEASDSLQYADCLAAGWYEYTKNQEEELFKLWGWRGKRIPLRSLEPYYIDAADSEERWTSLLTDQSVCVVSSFAATAKMQVEKGEERVWSCVKGGLWGDRVKWNWVQTGYAPSLALGRAGWEESPEDWSEAVAWVVDEVMKTNARIVLIGCGGLGMIIGARLKQKGKICIVLGGATQVLFGIKGRRWEKHSVISKFWNSEWVWPSLEETPGGANSVEDSCYWSNHL